MRRKWSGHDVPSAARRASAARARKSSTAGVVGEVADLRAGRSTRGRATAGPGRPPGRGARPPGSGSNPGTTGPNGSARPRSARNASAVRMISSEFASHSSLVAPQAVMPWPPRMHPIASGWSRCTAAMSSPSWKPGRRHGTHTTRSPKHSLVSASPSAAVARAMPASGCRWSTCAELDQAVHRRVDRRRGAAAAVQAVVERRDHLVLALDARVDADERAQPVEPQHGEPGLGQGAEVAAGSLDPQQLDRLAGDRVDLGALGRGVATGVVGVARVGPEPVAAGDQLGDRRVLVGHQAPQPACWPPTRSATICSA